MKGRLIVEFVCQGCMAEDWREKRRGIVSRVEPRVVYGAAKPVDFFVAVDDLGAEFDGVMRDVSPWGEYMMARYGTDERLDGAMVYLT